MGVSPVRCNLEQAAWVVGKSPRTFRRQLERMRRRMGGGVMRFDDIEAVFDSTTGWEVTFGESWLVHGRLVAWVPGKGAASRTAIKAGSLSCAARRNRPENSEESGYGDAKARPLGRLWLYCFVRDYLETDASGEVAP